MSAHRPKTAALLAYAEHLLSPEGRARLERHLAGCEPCRRELSAIRVYESFSDAARQTPPPEVDFAKMELTLAREARRVSGEIEIHRRRRPWLAIGASAAAAAGLAIFLAWPSPPAPTAEAPRVAPSVEPPARPDRPRLSPVVTLAAGTVQRRDSGCEAALDAEAEWWGTPGGGAPCVRSLALGETVSEGTTLRTGDDGVLHLELADGTAIVAEPRTGLTLSRAREGRVLLVLHQGRVTSRVAPLAEDARYEVRAAGYEVAVRGTHFAVSDIDGVVGVDLVEGRVALSAPDAEPLELRAPARWRSRGEAQEVEVPVPRSVAAGTEVRLAHPKLVRWEVDGTTVASAGPVRLRLTPGEHDVRGWDPGGRLYTLRLPVGNEPVAIEPSALRPEGPRLRPGHLEESVIAGVVRRGRPELARCYERALRAQSSAVAGQLRVRVTVGLMGDVERVNVVGADTRALSDCVSSYVRRWVFPPPGGPVTFEVPVQFSARL